MDPGLDTARLRLRPWREEDVADFLRLAQDREVLRYVNGGEPWTEEQAKGFVSRQVAGLAARGYCRWKLVSREDDAFAGFCGGEPVEALRDVEIGWWIVRDRWGAGLATEAARVAYDDLRGRVGLPRIVSIAHRDNAPSIRIMQTLGLAFERAVEHHGFPCVLYAWTGRRTPCGIL